VNIVLASSSPRRKELLEKIIKDFSVINSDFDEKTVIYNGDCKEYVKDISLGKAIKVSENLKEDSIVIACDTVVYYKSKIFGKPKDKEEAYSMLKSLSGNMHQVCSGITIINKALSTIKCEAVCTDVFFSNISDYEINKYLDSLEWVDKAGGYGIQGKASIFVEKIHGCYYNVVGLPLNCLYNMLLEMGVNL
jgi:septum formation protein